jgi:alkanesulfonate monooxygenase SsuD/methylene tetrahydromethanopterin reductase-like flavin-dependent oxidoreductase (luciferase family)
MQVGVFYFPTNHGIDITELARALEARGFASLYLPEHAHIPVSGRSPFPASRGRPRDAGSDGLSTSAPPAIRL